MAYVICENWTWWQERASSLEGTFVYLMELWWFFVCTVIMRPKRWWMTLWQRVSQTRGISWQQTCVHFSTNYSRLAS